MFGGNDSNNMVIPTSATEFAQYDAGRARDLAIPRPRAAAASPSRNTPGRDVRRCTRRWPACATSSTRARPPSWPTWGRCWRPPRATQYRNRSVPLPQNLFSHSDQQAQWQSSISDDATRTGWGGRIADLMKELNGTNHDVDLHLGGGQQPVGERHDDLLLQGLVQHRLRVSSTTRATRRPTRCRAAFRELIGTRRSAQRLRADVGRTPSRAPSRASGAAGRPRQLHARHRVPRHRAWRPARCHDRPPHRRARGALGVTRQVFFASIGGFDTHGADQLGRQNELLGEMSGGGARLLRRHGGDWAWPTSVTLFTASDFNRTFPSNGKGIGPRLGQPPVRRGRRRARGRHVRHLPDARRRRPRRHRRRGAGSRRPRSTSTRPRSPPGSASRRGTCR